MEVREWSWRSASQKARALAGVAARVGGLYVALLMIDAVLASFLARNDYEQGYWYRGDAGVAAADLGALGERLAAAYPDAAIRVAEAQGAPAHCGEGAMHLVVSFRARMLGAEAVLEDIPRVLRESGLPASCQLDGLRFRIGSISTWAGPLHGALLFAPVLLLILFLARQHEGLRRRWADWHSRVTPAQGARIALAVALPAFAGVTMLGMFGYALGWIDASDSRPLAATRNALLFIVPTAVLVAPLVEEYLFRALLLERFARIIPPSLALVWTALSFAAMHLPQSGFLWIAYFIPGLALGALWLRTRSLLACWVGHAAWNAAAVTLTWVMLGESAVPAGM